MIRLLPLLAALFVVALAWLGTHLTRLLYASSLEVAKRSNVAVINAVRASMMSDGGHREWHQVLDQVAADPNTLIDVVNARGSVVYSSDRSLIGRTFELSSRICVQCHTGGKRQATAQATFIRDPDNSRYQVFAAPLANRPDCRRCHVSQGAKIGVVLVRQSLEPIHAQVRTVQLALAVAGAVALLLSLLVMRVLLGRFVSRPLRQLETAARAIGAGDLEYRVRLSEPSELSVLAETLNSAADRLRAMIDQLGRQRDDFESLYRLVDQLSRSITPEERRQRSVELASEIFGADCSLVRVVAEGGASAERLTLTSREGQAEVVDRELPATLEAVSLPSSCSKSLVRRWLAGELDDLEQVEDGTVIGYPLRRHGQSLGLLLRTASGRPEGTGTDGPRLMSAMDRTLCKHLAIALEFSTLQGELIARERLAAIGETVAGLAHCLKNTLNGFRAGEYVVDRARETGNQQRLRDGWRVMKNAARQVERLTLDMLYYVKDRIPERKPANPNLILQEVAGVLEEMATTSGIELRTDLAPDMGEIWLDRNAVYRAVLDLVSNAIDACVESEAGNRVILRSRRTGDQVTLSVEDNGVGIGEDIRANLFTRFFSTKAGKGTGLGLSVVKKVADEHGGRVEVTSQPGQGATFSIHLPVHH